MPTKPNRKQPEPKPAPLGERTLMMTLADGKDQKITIPKGAWVTFGPTIPYKGKNQGAYERSDGYSLRVYANKAKDSLVAVFCDVKSFRDLSIPCAKLVIREAGKSVWKSDEDGYKVEREVKREKSFEDLALLEDQSRAF